MSRLYSIVQSFHSLFNIQKGEKKGVQLLLVFSFLSGISFVFYSTATVSLFISTFTADVLPYAFIASGIMGYLLWYIFARIQQYLAFGQLLVSGYLFLLFSILLLLFMAESSGNKWWYFFMFVWMRFFTFLNAVMFGGLFARIFNIQQGKRLFAFISAGDVVSQMLGYFSIPLIIKSTGIAPLFWICIGGILFQIVLILFLKQQYKEKFKPQMLHESKAISKEEVVDKITGSYYLLMFLVSLLPMLGFYYVDYMFLTELKLEYTSGEAVAGFLGLFLGAVAIVELLTRLFISGRVLTLYGLKLGIHILPVTLLLSTLVVIFFSLMPGFTGLVFSMIALSKLLERVLRFSFNEPAYQIFYQLVPPEKRFSLRSKMEGVPKAWGVIIAGVFILVFNLLGLKSSLYLSALFLIILIGWLLISRAAYKVYCEMLAQFVKLKFLTVNTSHSHNHAVYQEKQGTIIKVVDPSEWGLFSEMNHIIMGQDRDTVIAEKRYASFAVNSLLPAIYFKEWFVKEPVIRQLLKLQFHAGENLAAQVRILELLAILESEEGFVKEQLLAKSPLISQMAAKCLLRYQIQMSTREKLSCKLWLEEMMGNQLWYHVVIEDLGDDPLLADLKVAVKKENSRLTELIFDVLGFVYEPAAVAAIWAAIKDGTEGGDKIMAYELLENFFEQPIREKLSAVFLQDEITNKLQLLHDFYPQKRLTVSERLIDIIHKEYQVVPLFIKLLAIQAIGKRNDSFKEFILVECLQSIHPLLAVTAAEQLRAAFPETYRKAFDKLPLEQQKQIKAVHSNWSDDMGKIVDYAFGLPIPLALLPFLYPHFISGSEKIMGRSCYLKVDKNWDTESSQWIHTNSEQKLYVPNHSSDIFTAQQVSGFYSNPALSFFSYAY